MVRMRPAGLGLVALAVVCAVIAWTGAAHAGWARVQEVTSPAQVEDAAGEERELVPGMEMGPGDTVSTGAGGHALLVLDDGSSLELFEETVLELNLVLAGEDEGLSFMQHLGHMAADIVGLESPDLVVTPCMVIGIRGTKFTVSVAEDGASAVSVQQGEVSAATESLTGESSAAEVAAGREVLLERPGEAIRLRERRILAPSDWDEEREARLMAMLPHLPERLSQAPGKAREIFGRMQELAAELPGHVAAMQDLKAQLEAMDQERSARRTALRAALAKEAVSAMAKARRLRVLGGELRAMFVRARRLGQVLPQHEAELGAEYGAVMEDVARMESLRMELAPQAQELMLGVRDTLAPVREQLLRAARLLGREQRGMAAERGGVANQ